ncbi:MAG: hypothetical protein C4338_05955, partial [Rhodanobacteraceae bacterium]
LPALKRALPGLRIVLVTSDPHDALLNWLAFGANGELAMRDPVAAARWLKRARAHLKLAEELLPACVIDDAGALSQQPEAAQSKALAELLGLDALAPGALVRIADKNRAGLPVSFERGHAAHYSEALAEAFAALD